MELSNDMGLKASTSCGPLQTHHHLVSCLNIFLFFHILGIIIPTDELIFFRKVG